MRDAKKRLRRTMMFLNAQKPGLIKDPYIYGADSLMLDLEDAVAENQKDAARFSLFHALRTIDYHGAERIVRINGLDTPFCDGVRNLRGFEKVVWYRTVRWRLHERSAYPHHGNRNRTDGSKTAACHRCTGSRCTVF